MYVFTNVANGANRNKENKKMSLSWLFESYKQNEVVEGKN